MESLTFEKKVNNNGIILFYLYKFYFRISIKVRKMNTTFLHKKGREVIKIVKLTMNIENYQN